MIGPAATCITLMLSSTNATEAPLFRPPVQIDPSLSRRPRFTFSAMELLPVLRIISP